MLQEDALEEAEDAAAEESGAMAASRAGRRAVARVATVSQFASLFNGAQIQSGDEGSGMRVFINPDNGVEVKSILFDGKEMLGEYEENQSVLLPKESNGTLKIITSYNPNAINDIESEGESAVRVEGGNIIAPEGSEVLDLNGRRVTASNLRPGIYIVRIPRGKAVKVRL